MLFRVPYRIDSWTIKILLIYIFASAEKIHLKMEKKIFTY